MSGSLARLSLAVLAALTLTVVSGCMPPPPTSGGRSWSTDGVGLPWQQEGNVTIENMNISTEIQGEYAASTMAVDFAADAGEVNHGTMRFRLPAGAVIYKAELYIPAEDRWEEAETLGRREGERIFNDVTRPPPIIITYPRDPLLIQRIGVDEYQARVYPVSERNGLKIRIYYAHLLERTADGYVLRLPFDGLSVIRRFFTWESSIALDFELGIDVTYPASEWSAGSWATPVSLDAGIALVDAAQGLAGIISGHWSTTDGDSDMLLELEPAAPREDAGALLYQSSDPGIDDCVHVWWRPGLDTIPELASSSRAIVFLIDRSASMGESGRLDASQAAVAERIAALGLNDMYGVVSFGDTATAFSDTLTPSSDTADAIAWTQQISAGGGTALADAMAKGVEIGETAPPECPSIDFVILTDGVPDIGATSVESLLEGLNEASGPLGRQVRLYCCAIGNQTDVAEYAELTARKGGTTLLAVSAPDINPALATLCGSVREGGMSATSLDVTYPGRVDSEEFSWQRIFSGTLLHAGSLGRPTGEVELTLDGESADQNAVQLDEALPEPASGTGVFEFIAAPLSAKARADALERVMDESGETQDRIDEAVKLAKKYGIVTRYSSKLALETAQMYIDNGIPKVARNAAGIALDTVTGSPEDESAEIPVEDDPQTPQTIATRDSAAAGEGCAIGAGCGTCWFMLLLAMCVLVRATRPVLERARM